MLSVNYRGSTGFGKAFINAANLEWGGKMHDDLIDAVDWAIEQSITDHERVAIFRLLLRRAAAGRTRWRAERTYLRRARRALLLTATGRESKSRYLLHAAFGGGATLREISLCVLVSSLAAERKRLQALL